MALLFPHHSHCRNPWPWKHFTPWEVACGHCGELYLDPASMDALQALRDAWQRPILINSGHRCAAHNLAVGGAPASRHLELAFDCRCPKADQEAFIALARSAGFTGIGRYAAFVHLDLGPRREWTL